MQFGRIAALAVENLDTDGRAHRSLSVIGMMRSDMLEDLEIRTLRRGRLYKQDERIFIARA